MSEENGADVDLQIAGQGFKFRNVKSLNTLATVATLILCILIGYVVFEHKTDARAEGVALAQRDAQLSSAIREMASSNRVLSCLMATKQDDREAKLAQCERMAR